MPTPAQLEALKKHKIIAEALKVVTDQLQDVQVVGVVMVHVPSIGPNGQPATLMTPLPLIAGHMLDFEQYVKLMRAMTEGFEAQLTNARKGGTVAPATGSGCGGTCGN